MKTLRRPINSGFGPASAAADVIKGIAISVAGFDITHAGSEVLIAAAKDTNSDKK